MAKLFAMIAQEQGYAPTYIASDTIILRRSTTEEAGSTVVLIGSGENQTKYFALEPIDTLQGRMHLDNGAYREAADKFDYEEFIYFGSNEDATHYWASLFGEEGTPKVLEKYKSVAPQLWKAHLLIFPDAVENAWDPHVSWIAENFPNAGASQSPK